MMGWGWSPTQNPLGRGLWARPQDLHPQLSVLLSLCLHLTIPRVRRSHILTVPFEKPVKAMFSFVLASAWQDRPSQGSWYFSYRDEAARSHTRVSCIHP